MIKKESVSQSNLSIHKISFLNNLKNINLFNCIKFSELFFKYSDRWKNSSNQNQSQLSELNFNFFLLIIVTSKTVSNQYSLSYPYFYEFIIKS